MGEKKMNLALKKNRFYFIQDATGTTTKQKIWFRV